MLFSHVFFAALGSSYPSQGTSFQQRTTAKTWWVSLTQFRQHKLNRCNPSQNVIQSWSWWVGVRWGHGPLRPRSPKAPTYRLQSEYVMRGPTLYAIQHIFVKKVHFRAILGQKRVKNLKKRGPEMRSHGQEKQQEGINPSNACFWQSSPLGKC